MSNNKNILFYSQRCRTCSDLLMILRNENLLNYFEQICVDDKLDRLPQNMMVPTMLLINVPKPLIVEETFQWVKQMKFLKQQPANQNRQFTPNNVIEPTKRGPVGYDDEIMSGVSDRFAFTRRDEALPHAYFGVNEEDKHIIFTAPNDKKINKKDQTKLIGNLESKRSEQDNTFSTLMKQEQANAVMRDEHEKFAYEPPSKDLTNQQKQALMQQQMAIQQQQMMQQQMMQQRRF